MEIKAYAKSIKISPRKIRLVADMIRHLSIDNALSALSATSKRAGKPLFKVLKSALANAQNNFGLDKKNMLLSSISVNEGPALKRFHPSSRGRTHPYKKRSSNISIVLKSKTVKGMPLKPDEKMSDLNKSEKLKKKGVKK